MSEAQVILKAKKRDSGKRATKESRQKGMTPGVFYIKNEEPIAIEAEPIDLRSIVYTSQTKIVNLHIEGEDEPRECVVKEVQFDPVSDEMTHIDFMGITRGQKITVEVPVILKGTPIGTKEGGILQHALRAAKIECLPKNMPGAIEVDVSELSLGDSVYLKDVGLPDVEFITSTESTVASIVQPRVLVTTEAEEAEAEEVELEGEEAEEKEEGEEETKEAEE